MKRISCCSSFRVAKLRGDRHVILVLLLPLIRGFGLLSEGLSMLRLKGIEGRTVGFACSRSNGFEVFEGVGM